jgi:hypothetical protein
VDSRVLVVDIMKEWSEAVMILIDFAMRYECGSERLSNALRLVGQ